ncbi:OmpA family protein [[Limnothrix rosea] IAM M-220]|uniref:OmpA family protein n=1 Tax=[Limnothrix rosea] IAM M-220 TaxID=454133 RepID=UPI000969BDA0|nr:OmpA family protein [[Limnothrix rosea] IAM M-220]OKH11159.1 hypothetical protein NIES208_17720 [[Limnothrix rosea] IAM M-220]
MFFNQKSYVNTELDSEVDSHEDESSVFLSISDLMSALLMLFVLLLVTVLIKLAKQQEDLTNQQQDITRIIVGQLEGELKANGIEADVDPETGDVSLRDSILFDRNSSALKPAGKQNLQKLMPIYSQILFENEMIASQVNRVVIEGHTSAYGDADENMRLSLLRSWEVANYTLYKMPFANKEQKQKLEQKIMVAGRGENDATKQADFAGDRKVTLRIELKGDNYEGIFQNSPIELREVQQ